MATVREQTRQANRERALDEIQAASGDEGCCRAAGIDVISRLGNFPVNLNGRRTDVAGLVAAFRSRWLLREEFCAWSDGDR